MAAMPSPTGSSADVANGRGPTTAGVLCTKVSRYTERTYHPDRLLHPMRRVGKKGEGKFARISWDDAIAEIASKLGAIAARDPQAILPYSYCGTMGLVQGESMSMRFFNHIGASQLDRTICAMAGFTGYKYTIGATIGTDIRLEFRGQLKKQRTRLQIRIGNIANREILLQRGHQLAAKQGLARPHLAGYLDEALAGARRHQQGVQGILRTLRGEEETRIRSDAER